jgi:CRISPR-associated protein Csb1
MATTINYEMIRKALQGSASAFRRRTVLHPAGGDGDKVFPPTYLDGPYATETRVINGEKLPTVLLDSVQSQANRMELALLRAVRSGLIEMPLWQVDFSGTEVRDVGTISALEAPHRLSDAIFRDSLLDGKAFPGTREGEAIESSSSQNSTALLETCPTALVFGIWHSTGKRGGMGAKFARAIAAEIVGIDYERGRHAAGRIDPLNISKGADVFVSEKDVNNWQLEAAGKDFKKKKPSEVNHGNIPPSLPGKDDPSNGGVTIREAIQILVLSLPAIRRLSFPLNGRTAEGANLAAQALLVALGLVAAELAQAVGFDLRSRCVLDGTPGTWELLDRGSVVAADGTLDALLQTYSVAVREVRGAGFAWKKEAVSLVPQDKLVKLVSKSRAIQAQGAQE